MFSTKIIRNIINRIYCFPTLNVQAAHKMWYVMSRYLLFFTRNKTMLENEQLFILTNKIFYVHSIYIVMHEKKQIELNICKNYNSPILAIKLYTNVMSIFKFIRLLIYILMFYFHSSIC